MQSSVITDPIVLSGELKDNQTLHTGTPSLERKSVLDKRKVKLTPGGQRRQSATDVTCTIKKVQIQNGDGSNCYKIWNNHDDGNPGNIF